MIRQKNKIKFIIVNLITLTRVIGSILIPIYYFNKGIKYMGILIGLLFLTDLIDGKLSRYWKVESFLGSLLDTISDKLFAFVMLAILSYEFPIVFMVILLELLIFIVNTLAFNGNKNIQSSKLGKLKTTILDVNVTIMYLYKAGEYFSNILPGSVINFLNNTESGVSYILVGIIVGMQLVTVCDYSKNMLKKTTYEKLNKKDLKSAKEIFSLMTDRDFYVKNKDASLKKFLYKTIE